MHVHTTQLLLIRATSSSCYKPDFFYQHNIELSNCISRPNFSEKVFRITPHKATPRPEEQLRPQSRS